MHEWRNMNWSGYKTDIKILNKYKDNCDDVIKYGVKRERQSMKIYYLIKMMMTMRDYKESLKRCG